MLVTFLLSEFDFKKRISWTFHVYDSSESSSTYDMIIGHGEYLLGELGIIMYFKDQTVTYGTDNIKMKYRYTCTL
jgi:hypothetical protein